MFRVLLYYFDNTRGGRMDRNYEARAAGLAYLVTIASGIFAEAVARAAARDEIRATGLLVEQMPLYRWGVMSDLVMIAAYLAVTLLLYRLLKPTSAVGSAIAASFSFTGLAILAAAMALLLIPLANPGAAGDALRLHSRLYGLTGFFFGLYCLGIGWLLLRSRLTPRWVAGLMALAGAAFLGNSTLTLVAPAVAERIPDVVMLLSLIGEGAVAVWLALFGTSAEPLQTKG